MEPEERLGRTSERRAGVFTRGDAVTAGMTDDHLQHLADVGVYRRLALGRYAVSGAPRDWMQEAWAAVVGLGDLGGLSHRAAATLWDLTGYPPGPVEVLAPVGSGSRNPLAIVHRSRNLDRRDFTKRSGLLVTTPTRTLLDLASTETDATRFLSAFDDAICRGLVRAENVARAAPRVIRGPRPGRELIDHALTAWTPGPDPSNSGEMAVVRLLLSAGYPAPERQFPIRDARGRLLARVDVAYPWASLAIERDSQRWHGSRGAVDRDVRRELQIQAAGWQVRRISEGELRMGGQRFLAAVEIALRPFLDAGAHLRQSA